MTITGVHTIFHTSEPEALRAAFRDVFHFDHVDAHDGWLIFALPAAELGVHPGDAPHHEVSFMCDDLAATKSELEARGIRFDGEPAERGFGLAATMVLPGDVQVVLYQPRHKTAI